MLKRAKKWVSKTLYDLCNAVNFGLIAQLPSDDLVHPTFIEHSSALIKQNPDRPDRNLEL